MSEPFPKNQTRFNGTPIRRVPGYIKFTTGNKGVRCIDPARSKYPKAFDLSVKTVA